jgi:hypothetical protein
MQINWNEPSTKRGLVWALTGIVSVVMSIFGKDPTPVLTLGSTVAGTMGVVIPDNQR